MTSSDNSEKRSLVIGDRVRVLAVPESLPAHLPTDEVRRIMSLLGKVLEIGEIDEHGVTLDDKEYGIVA
jgi:hypothetical protein